MRKIIFSVLLSVLSLGISAQTRIKIQSSSKGKVFQSSGFSRIIQPVFEHDGSTLAADSADYNPSANTFDAFGHIVITQPSGTVIYSDLLNYNGNTKLAILTNNVRLIDGDATLTTSLLTYNMASRMGTYPSGGKIVNGKNVLTSKKGYYFASTRDAYFRYDVVLTSPDALIKTDTLRYNATSKIAYFYGPTNIYGKDDTLYTENGTYNTENDQARFGKKNLYTQGSKSLKGDSLFYDRKAGYGRAIGNITFIDTAEKAELHGGVGLYRKSDESILVTRNPYVVIISESDSAKVDSIFYTADTLFSKVVFTRDIKPYRKDELKADTDIAGTEPPAAVKRGLSSTVKPGADSTALRRTAVADTTKPTAIVIPDKKIQAPAGVNPQINTVAAKPLAPTGRRGSTLPVPADTLASAKIAAVDSIPADTTRSRIVAAYHNAKIFKSDLQARADSMFFSYSDSTIRCYVKPMLWAQGSQLSGDTIYLQLKNKKLDNMILQNNSFIVNSDTDSTNFNQIKGKMISGYFQNNKLNQMFVDGNAESIYYAKDDTTYVGLNHQVSSRIKMIFENGKLKTITPVRSVQGSTTPMDEITEEDKILKGFIWKPKERPKSKEEIIPQLAKKELKPKLPAKSVPKKVVPAKRVPPKKTTAKS
ncbi:MAG: OstA-like protein [Daejeonella sp.]